MKVIGLTGGIGSGKSTVAQILRELGALVIDADRVAHELYEPGTPGWHQVVNAFGPGIVSEKGTIDRKKLAAIVFADPQALAQLNGIMRPLVDAELRRRLEEYRKSESGAPVVLEAALLLEAGWHALVDQVWLVTAPPELIRQRLTAQRSMDPADVEARQNAQWKDEQRRPFAHVIIDNSGDLESLRRQVRQALDRDC
jgi:dephospho-CoA kinase